MSQRRFSWLFKERDSGCYVDEDEYVEIHLPGSEDCKEITETPQPESSDVNAKITETEAETETETGCTQTEVNVEVETPKISDTEPNLSDCTIMSSQLNSRRLQENEESLDQPKIIEDVDLTGGKNSPYTVIRSSKTSLADNKPLSVEENSDVSVFSDKGKAEKTKNSSICTSTELGFLSLMQSTEIEVTPEGVNKEFDCGVSVVVPPGAVEKKMSITLQLLMNSNQTSLPENFRPISPLVKVEPSNACDELKKSIAITIPHCLDPGSKLLSESCPPLGVIKSNEKSPPYKFKKFNDCQLTFKVVEDQGYVTINTKHFCFLQICVDMTNREEAIQASYCLCPMHPKVLDPYNRSYYYVLTYYTPIFIKSVKEQFPDYILKDKVLRFQFKDSQRQRVTIKNSFPESSYWTVTLSSSRKNDYEPLYGSALDRWGENSPREFDVDCGVYPPKFHLKCSVNSACEPEIVNISVEFEDICARTEGREPIVDNFTIDLDEKTASEVAHCAKRQPHQQAPEYLAFCRFKLNLMDLLQEYLSTFNVLIVQHGLVSQEAVTNITTTVNSGIRDQLGRLLSAIGNLIKHYNRMYKVFLSVLRDMNNPPGPLTDLIDDMGREILPDVPGDFVVIHRPAETL